MLRTVGRLTHRIELHFARNPRHIWIAIFALFFIGQAVATLIESLPLGPKLSPDSSRYISAGETFPNIDSVQFGYVGYCFLMWIDNLLGAQNWFIISLQATAAIGAGRVVWRIANRFGGNVAGLLAASLLLLNPLIATWTRFVLTETLFYVSTVLLLEGLVRILDGEHRITLVMIVGFVGSITMRPNGILMIPALAACVVLMIGLNKRVRLLAASGAFVLIGLTVSLLPTFESGGGGVENSFVQRTARGEVLWNDPEWSIDMPEVSPDATSNTDYLKYILDHPADVAVLGSARLGAELIQVRPQRDRFYNVFTALVMVSFIGLFIAGAVRIRKSSLVRAVTLISLPYMGLIMITWAIQEGRFGWWFMTTWIPVVALSAEHLLTRRQEQPARR